ncbi:hypothetical protein [Streptomyces sp. KR80]|uniref:hypothetical protein n=1 Tax=Streptomyces sp. KR80 TaxID=3457426 RepID=UPI003FD1F751
MSASRRAVLGAALGGAVAAGLPATAAPASAASWQLRWSPSASSDAVPLAYRIAIDALRAVAESTVHST